MGPTLAPRPPMGSPHPHKLCEVQRGPNSCCVWGAGHTHTNDRGYGGAPLTPTAPPKQTWGPSEEMRCFITPSVCPRHPPPAVKYPWGGTPPPPPSHHTQGPPGPPPAPPSSSACRSLFLARISFMASSMERVSLLLATGTVGTQERPRWL